MSRLGAVGRTLRRLLPHRRGGRGKPQFMVGYTIPLGEESHNWMRRLQLRILRDYQDGLTVEDCLHITIKQAFQTAELEPFERHFDRLIREIDPFEIEIRNVGFFDEGIIYLDVVPGVELNALRKRVLGDLSSEFGVQPYPIEGDLYRFHATIARASSPRVFERARQALESVHVDFRFRCDSLDLLCHTGRGWLTYRHSTLSRA